MDNNNGDNGDRRWREAASEARANEMLTNLSESEPYLFGTQNESYNLALHILDRIR